MYEGNVENTRRRQVFSTILDFAQMYGVFYHSVIHGIGFGYIVITCDRNTRKF